MKTNCYLITAVDDEGTLLRHFVHGINEENAVERFHKQSYSFEVLEVKFMHN